MITQMKLNQIIQFKFEGKSNRETARLTSTDRKTVKRRFDAYREDQINLDRNHLDKDAKDQLGIGRKYDSTDRKKKSI